MACRGARLSQEMFRRDLAFCCACGSADLEVCHTSKALGPHLCPTCAQYVLLHVISGQFLEPHKPLIMQRIQPSSSPHFSRDSRVH